MTDFICMEPVTKDEASARQADKENSCENNGLFRKSIALFLCFGLLFAAAGAGAAKAADAAALDERQQSIVAISAFTAQGAMEKLKPALAQGLESGLSVNEIKEILVHLYAYTGFPRSLNGIHAFMAVMEEREKAGIMDMEGREASPMPSDLDRDRYGAETRARLAGQSEVPPPAGYQLFAPAIDSFLKEHLFADIFYRDNLDWLSRELATISALAAMAGTAGQLRFHLGAAMNMALTTAQMQDFLAVLEEQAGAEEARAAREVLALVLADRTAQTK